MTLVSISVLYTLRVVSVTLAVASAGAIGYLYGHQEGLEDSDSAAMRLFFDRCAVDNPPDACRVLLDAIGHNRTITYGGS